MTLFIDDGAPGYWADAIANSPCLRVVPALPLQQRLDAREGGHDARPFVAVSLSLHDGANSRTASPPSAGLSVKASSEVLP